MAGVVSQHSTAGFYGCPVTKGLMMALGASHASTHVPAFAAFFRRVFLGSQSTLLPPLDPPSLARSLLSRLVFPDTRSTILALFLLYTFRVFERRLGSLRFCTRLALAWGLGVAADLLLCPLLSLPPPPGPLPLILPLFVPFYLHIPTLSSSAFGPLPLSSKTLTYVLGLQLSLSSSSSLLSTFTSLCTGLLLQCSPLLSSLSLPPSLGRLASLVFSPLASSAPPPSSTLLGATLDIQRTQQAEAVEAQVLRARARMAVPQGGRQMRLEELWGRAGLGGRQGQHQAAPVPTVASPVLVAALTDMGFPRDRVEEVLRQTDNDLDQATNLLLAGL